MRTSSPFRAPVLLVVLTAIAIAVLAIVISGDRRSPPVAVGLEPPRAAGPEAADRGAVVTDATDRTVAGGGRARVESPAAAAVLRGTLREADGRPCSAVPIHRATRSGRYPESTAPAAAPWSQELGRTSEEGDFEVRFEPPLAADEWLEFRLCEVAFARYRPAHLRGEHALLVPQRIETEVVVVGLGPGETWSVESHPAEREASGGADLFAVLDVPVASPDGELLLRCHYHGWPEQQESELRVSLPKPAAWSFGVRAATHTIDEPFRIADAGARVVFRAGLAEQRIVIEVVDREGDAVPVGGRVEVHGERGHSLGEFEAGRAELRPPFGGRIEGDLRAVAHLDDGETFAMSWPEEIWRAAPRLTLARGQGLAAVTVEVGGAVSDIRGVNADGTPHHVARDDPPWVPGPSWWEPTPDGRHVRICVPTTVWRLWCVARRAEDDPPFDRIAVLEKTGPGAFTATWRDGRIGEITNALPSVPLRAVRVQIAIPDLPPTEAGRWLTLRAIPSGELPDPISAFRTTGLETRVQIVKADGPERLMVEPASWR